MADLTQIQPNERQDSLNGDSAPSDAAGDAAFADDAPLPKPLSDKAPTRSRLARSRWVWQGKMPDAFWKAATVFSFAINLVLVVAVLGLGLLVFQIKAAIAQPLLGGLHTSFLEMDASHIVTTIHVVDTIHVTDTIHVNDTIPVVFNVPLSTNTTVVLNHDTSIPNTTVYLNGLPVPTNIVLPAGTPLDISLNINVPVSKTVPVVLDVPITLNVPVNLNVPVDIPLKQTELHTPFIGLANLIGPYDSLLASTPSSWAELLYSK